jgi:hypothetical protein
MGMKETHSVLAGRDGQVFIPITTLLTETAGAFLRKMHRSYIIAKEL